MLLKNSIFFLIFSFLFFCEGQTGGRLGTSGRVVGARQTPSEPRFPTGVRRPPARLDTNPDEPNQGCSSRQTPGSHRLDRKRAREQPNRASIAPRPAQHMQRTDSTIPPSCQGLHPNRLPKRRGNGCYIHERSAFSWNFLITSTVFHSFFFFVFFFLSLFFSSPYFSPGL